MDDLRAARLVETVLRCYPARWKRRHGDEAAELAALPTLGVYDRILVQKAFFTWHDVHEGDIVVFSHPPLDHCGGSQEDDLVK